MGKIAKKNSRHSYNTSYLTPLASTRLKSTNDGRETRQKPPEGRAMSARSKNNSRAEICILHTRRFVGHRSIWTGIILIGGEHQRVKRPSFMAMTYGYGKSHISSPEQSHTDAGKEGRVGACIPTKQKTLRKPLAQGRQAFIHPTKTKHDLQ